MASYRSEQEGPCFVIEGKDRIQGLEDRAVRIALQDPCSQKDHLTFHRVVGTVLRAGRAFQDPRQLRSVRIAHRETGPRCPLGNQKTSTHGPPPPCGQHTGYLIPLRSPHSIASLPPVPSAGFRLDPHPSAILMTASVERVEHIVVGVGAARVVVVQHIAQAHPATRRAGRRRWRRSCAALRSLQLSVGRAVGRG